MTDTSNISLPPQALAKEARLRYVNDAMPGYGRIKQGKRFVFVDERKKRIIDPLTDKRIEALRIPPAWIEVWICPFPNGHIQATGKDEKGRKQYLYHSDWNTIATTHKFEKLLFFSDILPKIRQKVHMDMQERGLVKQKILATIVWMLEHTYIRIGNEAYAKENQHFGLTTLRAQHVDIHGPIVSFAFTGKSGVKNTVEVMNPRVVKIIRKLDELPGYELFQYLDENGQRHLVDSADVNEYLQQIVAADISAKDFRTWGGTVLCAESLVKIGPFATPTEEKKNIRSGVKVVAQQLRNTPTVCRNYYIHPTVIQTYQEEVLIPHFQRIEKQIDKKPQRLGKSEFAVKTLLEKYATH